MKISGNNIVTGVYLYDETKEFTPNDFVIDSGVIYVCKSPSKGEKPSESENFYIYLGDQGNSLDLSEYLEEEKSKVIYYGENKPAELKNYVKFMEESSGSNKYLSLGMLQAVMNSYMLGIDGRGIIGDYITYSSNTYEVNIKTPVTRGTFTNPETIISEIFTHPDINNATLRVSRLLPELLGLVGKVSINDSSSLDQKSCILRQYTYLREDSGDKVRVQELIDALNGLIWIRQYDIESTEAFAVSEWKCVAGESSDLLSNYKNLINVYRSKIQILDSLKSQLTSNFRYKSLTVPNTRQKRVTFRDLSNAFDVNVVVMKNISGQLMKSYETCVKLEVSSSPIEYLIGDDMTLTFTGVTGRGFTVSLSTTGSEEVWISSVYYKEYYG